jgi:hypothetical protein
MPSDKIFELESNILAPPILYNLETDKLFSETPSYLAQPVNRPDQLLVPISLCCLAQSAGTIFPSVMPITLDLDKSYITSNVHRLVLHSLLSNKLICFFYPLND